MLNNKQVQPRLLTFENRHYDALFKHRQNYTKFWDDGWKEFVIDYGLCVGDSITMFLNDWGLDLHVKTFPGLNSILPLPFVGQL